jgi:hypothetical protein
MFFQLTLFWSSLLVVDVLHATSGGFVLSDSLSSLWLASFGLLACLDFGLGPLFLFSLSFFGCFLFIKFVRVS